MTIPHFHAGEENKEAEHICLQSPMHIRFYYGYRHHFISHECTIIVDKCGCVMP